MEKSRLHLDGCVSVDMTTGFAFVRTFPPTHHKVPDGSQCQIYNISVDEGEKKVKKKKNPTKTNVNSDVTPNCLIFVKLLTTHFVKRFSSLL